LLEKHGFQIPSHKTVSTRITNKATGQTYCLGNLASIPAMSLLEQLKKSLPDSEIELSFSEKTKYNYGKPEKELQEIYFPGAKLELIVLSSIRQTINSFRVYWFNNQTNEEKLELIAKFQRMLRKEFGISVNGYECVEACHKIQLAKTLI
jgi:hypothetical protein